VSVTVEHLGPCKKLLRVEIEPSAVKTKFEEVSADFARHARLPGFRPGKVPKPVIERTFGDRIRDEVKRKLLNESYEAALKEHQFVPVTQPKIEEVQFGAEQTSSSPPASKSPRNSNS
jgi:trigger factor